MNYRKICALLALAMLLSLLPVKAYAEQTDPGETLSEEITPAAETEPTEQATKPETAPTEAPTEKPTEKPMPRATPLKKSKNNRFFQL